MLPGCKTITQLMCRCIGKVSLVYKVYRTITAYYETSTAPTPTKHSTTRVTVTVTASKYAKWFSPYSSSSICQSSGSSQTATLTIISTITGSTGITTTTCTALCSSSDITQFASALSGYPQALSYCSSSYPLATVIRTATATGTTTTTVATTSVTIFVVTVINFA